MFMILRLQTDQASGGGQRLPFGEIGDSTNLPEDQTGTLMIFGKVLDETSSEIQITDSDMKLYTAMVSNSMFAVTLTGESLPCQLRILDGEGQIEEEYPLTGLPEWQASAQLSEQIQGACPAAP